MAVIANTHQSGSATVNREELSDVINRVTPEETPIYSMIPNSGSCDSTNPEYSLEDLRAPAANIQLEGDEFAFNAVTPATRVGSRTQILREGFIVSDTQQVTDEAGDDTKLRRNMVKAGITIRKDVELAIVTNNASVGGNTRELGGMPTWFETNTSRGSGGADGGFSSGNTTAATNGTQRTLTKPIMDDHLEECYNSGGMNKYLVGSTYFKRVFTGFMNSSGTAEFRRSAGDREKRTIVATADIYEGDYGETTIMPNRVMTAGGGTVTRNVFNIDPDLWEFCWLRKIHRVKNLAKTGDASKGMLVGEGTLKSLNEKGGGVIADIFGLTSSS